MSACLFALMLYNPWGTVYVYFLIPVPFIVLTVLYAAYSVYMSRNGKDGIAHTAHLSGMFFGIIATILYHPGILQSFLYQLMHPHFGN